MILEALLAKLDPADCGPAPSFLSSDWDTILAWSECSWFLGFWTAPGVFIIDPEELEQLPELAKCRNDLSLRAPGSEYLGGVAWKIDPNMRELDLPDMVKIITDCLAEIAG